MSLRAVNLNLIPVLQMLLRERSVGRAAAALDMSPAATSEALGRLRVLLGDELLVRVGRAMELTSKAVDLVAPVDRLCADADSLLRQGDQFTPQTSQRQFKIATNDSLAYLTAPPVLDLTRGAAPSVQVHFSDVQADIFDRLAARDIDLLLMPRIFFDVSGAGPSIRIHTVRRDRLVIAFSADHPLADVLAPTEEDIARYPQILYNPTEVTLDGRQERAIMGQSHFHIAARLAQLTLIPPLITKPPYVAWIPKLLIDTMGEALRLQSRDLPFQTPNIDICLAWSPVLQRDPAHLWFRTLLQSALERRHDPAA